MLKRTLTLGHSPDPDDAFMFYGLATQQVETHGWSFEHVLQDIQTLNERAQRGELDVTAISIHAYPYVADKYVLTHCGSSMGDGYGPLVVTRTPMSVEALRAKVIAVPGTMTTAYLALNLLLGVGTFNHRVVPFDQILHEVEAGRADAGLIIHEGQLTYGNHHLHPVVDLGRWWKEETGLPLPLGGNAIHRQLGMRPARQMVSDNGPPAVTSSPLENAAAIREVTAILKESIRFSLGHREAAVAHALQYARDMGKDLADRFIGMYVNEWTLDYGDVGRRAIGELLRRGHKAGMIPDVGKIEFV